MLSRPEVYSQLARNFVGLRLDWEQGNHYKDRFGFVLGTGDQMLLAPTGEPIPHHQATKDGRPQVIYGRHGCDTTGPILEAVAQKHPTTNDLLKLDWFLWPQKAAHRPGGTYPAPPTAIAGYARLPLITLHGRIPAALEDATFLRWHVRQFIWVRGRAEGASEWVIHRVRDGLKKELSTDLAVLRPDTMSLGELGAALDRAWRDYMKDRPLTARGYLENPHGRWMRSVSEQMLAEEQSMRERAVAGTLLAPGRKAGERPPYLR